MKKILFLVTLLYLYASNCFAQIPDPNKWPGWREMDAFPAKTTKIPNTKENSFTITKTGYVFVKPSSFGKERITISILQTGSNGTPVARPVSAKIWSPPSDWASDFNKSGVVDRRNGANTLYYHDPIPVTVFMIMEYAGGEEDDRSDPSNWRFEGFAVALK